MNSWTFFLSVAGVARVSLTGTDWGNALTHSVVYFLSALHSILLLSLTHLLYVLLLNYHHLFISTAFICPSSILSFSPTIFSPTWPLFYCYLFITLHPSFCLSLHLLPLTDQSVLVCIYTSHWQSPLALDLFNPTTPHLCHSLIEFPPSFPFSHSVFPFSLIIPIPLSSIIGRLLWRLIV